MMRFHKKRGFTLLELMIVVIILGILASLAVPRFITAASKARKGTATAMLSAIRSSVFRYYVENNEDWPASIDELDLDMSPGAGWTFGAINPETNFGSVTHGGTSTTYTIAENGTVN